MATQQEREDREADRRAEQKVAQSLQDQMNEMDARNRKAKLRQRRGKGK